MRTFIWWNISFIILALENLLPALTSNLKMRECNSTINPDGTIANESQLPNCNGTERINLLSYEYGTRDSESANIHYRNLSSVDKIAVHRSCSLKQACRNMSLPINTIKQRDNNITYMLHVEYQCTDVASFTDICSKTETTISTPLHLISNENATLFEGCECRVNGSSSLILTDVRLNAKNSELCSQAVINAQVLTSSNRYVCNNESDSYFQDAIEMNHTGTIAFQTYSSEVAPEMVWLTLEPITSLKIKCSYDLKTNRKTISLTHPVSTSSNMSPGYSEEIPSSPAESSTTAGLSVFGVLATIVAIIYVLLKCRKKKRNVRSDLEPLQHSPTDCGSASTGNTTENTYTQIDPESYLKDPHFQEKHVYAKAVRFKSTSTDPVSEEEPYDVIAVNKRILAVTQNYDHVVLDSKLCVPEIILTLEDKTISPSTGDQISEETSITTFCASD